MTAVVAKHQQLELDAEDCLQIYRLLRLTRNFETRIAALYKQGVMYGGCFASTGNEATAVGSAFALDSADILCPLHRDLGAYLTRGEDPAVIALEYLGRKGSPTRGTDGNLHHANFDLNCIGMISHIGAMLPVVVGAVFAKRHQGHDVVGMTYVGDGGTSITDFHEGINYAAVQQVPVVFIVENNQFAFSTPTSKQYAGKSIADRAKGYGIPGVQIDGTNVLEVYGACREAVERGRNGGGPTLIESVTLRMRGHSEHDDFESYVPPAMLEEWAQKDPIERFESYLTGEEILTNARKARIERNIAIQLDKAFERALAAPQPDGLEAAQGVYAD